MGYTNVYWYKDGLDGWRDAGKFVEIEDFSYRTRKLPEPIRPEELKSQLDENSGMVVLVDIRGTASRQKEGYIDATAIHLPLYAFVEEYRKLPLDKKLVVYDIRGKQASSAVRFLLSQKYDFPRLTWLEDGIAGWAERGYPVKRE